MRAARAARLFFPHSINLKGLAKRSQHFNATSYNIVARCCDMYWTGWPNARNIFNATCGRLCAPDPWHATSGPSAHALVQQCCVNEYIIIQHPKCSTKNLTVFKFDPTSSNMLQHIATGWPNVCNMLCPTMLQDVELKCCKRLARPLSLPSFLKLPGRAEEAVWDDSFWFYYHSILQRLFSLFKFFHQLSLRLTMCI